VRRRFDRASATSEAKKPDGMATKCRISLKNDAASFVRESVFSNERRRLFFLSTKF